MGAPGRAKFQLSNRVWIPVVPLVLCLAVSVWWNLRQSQVITDVQKRTLAIERREAGHLRTEAQQANAVKKRPVAPDARLKALYREIDTLSRLNDQVFSRPAGRLKKTMQSDNPAETLSAP